MAMKATQGAGRSAVQAPFDAWAAGILAADVATASRAGAQSLAARRKRRLAELLSSTVRDSPLYRRLLKGRDSAAWSLHELPIARKRDLMRDFDDWVTDPEVRLDELRRFARSMRVRVWREGAGVRGATQRRI